MTAATSNTLRLVVGAAAIAAPVLHCITDAMEWLQGGFSPLQLWLNYLAFLPMPWLFLGIYALRAGLPPSALVGALLHGAAFTYFAYTTLFALHAQAPDYEALWRQLGITYTVHGAAMVAGGLLFAWGALRSRALPRLAAGLFAAGLMVNLGLAIVPAPDILQTVGTAVRNSGIVGMGYAILFGGASREARPFAGAGPPPGCECRDANARTAAENSCGGGTPGSNACEAPTSTALVFKPAGSI